MKFRQLLRPLHLTAVMFFSVSGGPYGLEPLLHDVGAPAALALVLITPLVWCLPVIVMVLELNSLMPLEGGYYQWVKAGIGRSWGFTEGWWTWLYALTDLAIYPVLFVQYLSFLVPDAGDFKIPICLAIVWSCVYLNLRGVLPVGRGSVTLGIAVLVPFIVLFGAGLFSHHSPTVTSHSVAPLAPAVMCMGLFNVMWNYLGWDNTYTIAEEVDSPIRSYVTASVFSLAAIVAVYFLSILVAGRSGIDPQLLEDRGFPVLGVVIGGWWLGAAISAGGMASALGLFLSALLSISRIPKVMADDGFLPALLTKLHVRTQVPHVSIVTCAAVVSVLILGTFGDLLIVDVTLYGAALMLEFIALIALRKRLPDQSRPFRIPLGRRGLIVLTMFPALCILLALTGLIVTESVHPAAAWVAVGGIVSGPLVWLAVRRKSPSARTAA